MRKCKTYFIVSIISLFAFFLGTSLPADMPPTDPDVDVKLHKDCLYPVVALVYANTPNSPNSSGFIIRSEKVKDNLYYNSFLTCAHCVDESKSHSVRVFQYEDWSHIVGSKEYRCIFSGIDRHLDIAIGYFISDHKMPTAVVDKDIKTYIGSDVFKIGCGMIARNHPRLAYGKVSNPVRHGDWKENWIGYSAHTVFGDSGGPLFYKYKVIGMSARVYTPHGFSPMWDIAKAIPIGRYHDMSKNNGGIYDFVFEPAIPLPRMSMHLLGFIASYEITE